ncbi:hypothetical protein, partial [Pseudomonas fluorescens]|uniref:hypothetical protein n=1 Tax=Pseudomonas fluorescens TaxID=294 RepID=UPI001CD776FE
SVDGVDGLKRPFLSAARTKANAPNKSGRLIGTTISAFSHSLFGCRFCVCRIFYRRALLLLQYPKAPAGMSVSSYIQHCALGAILNDWLDR